MPSPHTVTCTPTSWFGEAFDLIGNIIPLSKLDRRLIASVKKSWVSELRRRGTQPQTARPQL